MHTVSSRFIGAYGKEFLVANLADYQEALSLINNIVDVIRCVLKSDRLTRQMEVSMHVRDINKVTVMLIDNSYQYARPRMLCIFTIEEKKG